jgi:ATP-dependent 26S proteasome regulatory subunit
MEKTYLEKYSQELGKTNAEDRRRIADERNEWEQRRTSEAGAAVANNLGGGRSALSRREWSREKSDNMLMSNVLNPDNIATIVDDKAALQKEMEGNGSGSENTLPVNNEASEAAATRVSSLVATAGAGTSFDGETLGIGGLDDVLAQVKRRVWIPLAAPPQLLSELGIHPVRGLLLYGKPGCGKTLLARTLGNILSPMRPITVISGPEIMDKFVGSSEKVRNSLVVNRISFASRLLKILGTPSPCVESQRYFR